MNYLKYPTKKTSNGGLKLLVRTIEELSQLIKDGKEEEITEEERKALDEIIEAYINLARSITEVKTKI